MRFDEIASLRLVQQIFRSDLLLSNGRKLTTLKQAAEYIITLPKRESDAPEWQAAMQALILCADHGQHGADPMLARMGMLKALHRNDPPEPFKETRKETHWGRRKLARDT